MSRIHVWIRLPLFSREPAMLEMRPNCECCNCDLPANSSEARICSFECTFCSTCATGHLDGRCPNCGGELLPRPRRAAEKLQKFPATTTRTFKPEGCRDLDGKP